MRFFSLFFLVGLLALLVEVLLSYYFESIPFLVPNSTMILAVYLAFYEATPLGALLSFVFGLLRDAATTTILGPWAGTSVVAFTATILFAHRVFIQSGMNIAISVFAATAVGEIVYYGLRKGVDPLNFRPIHHLVLCAFLSAAIAPLLFSQLKRFFKKKVKLGLG